MSAEKPASEPKTAAADNSSSNKTSNVPKEGEAWGYDLYPERRGTFTAKWSNILIGKEGKENIDKFKCEQHVVECVKNSKLYTSIIYRNKSSVHWFVTIYSYCSSCLVCVC